MPKPAHQRLTFSGVFGAVATPLEHWSFNLTLDAGSAGPMSSDVVMDGLAEGARLCYAANIQTVMPSDVILTETRWAVVDGSGHVVKRDDGSFVQGIKETPVAGIGGVRAMPLSSAVCVSLQTGRAGPTGKGRFFLPWPAMNIGTTEKRLSIADAQLLADTAAEFIRDLNTVTSGADVVSVVSSKGYISVVDSVRVGRVPDVIRSRREDSPEGYLFSDLYP